jgi:hypothetical protein
LETKFYLLRNNDTGGKRFGFAADLLAEGDRLHLIELGEVAIEQHLLSGTTLEAAKVADLVLIPIQPVINDIETLPAIKDLLRIAGEKPALVVINNAPPTARESR